jgi:hypothetical protein
MRALNLLPCRFWGGPEKQTLRLSGWLRDYARVETIFAVMPTDAASLDGTRCCSARARPASNPRRSCRAAATT